MKWTPNQLMQGDQDSIESKTTSDASEGEERSSSSINKSLEEIIDPEWVLIAARV